jgi:predicted nuclease with TOPRIM domain
MRLKLKPPKKTMLPIGLPIGTIIKAVVALIIVLIVAGGAWYVTGLRADLAVSEMNNQKLKDGIDQQQALMEKMRVDIAQIQSINKDLQAQNQKQREDVTNLSKKFDKRDLGVVAAEKPEVIEKLVNRGSKNALRCLELASGAPLNDVEKNAKTPTEANRECPSLINRNYNNPTP